MNIFQFAMNFERENREYYEDRAAEVEIRSLKKLFLDLAEEERKHENIVKQLANDQKVKVVESSILPAAGKAFREVADDLPESVLPAEQVHIYQQAVEMERKSREFYAQKAEESELPAVKQVFLDLAGEEKKHQEIMKNIVVMVDRPNTWLEDAEWYHFEEY